MLSLPEIPNLVKHTPENFNEFCDYLDKMKELIVDTENNGDIDKISDNDDFQILYRIAEYIDGLGDEAALESIETEIRNFRLDTIKFANMWEIFMTLGDSLGYRRAYLSSIVKSSSIIEAGQVVVQQLDKLMEIARKD